MAIGWTYQSTATQSRPFPKPQRRVEGGSHNSNENDRLARVCPYGGFMATAVRRGFTLPQMILATLLALAALWAAVNNPFMESRRVVPTGLRLPKPVAPAPGSGWHQPQPSKPDWRPGQGKPEQLPQNPPAPAKPNTSNGIGSAFEER